MKGNIQIRTRVLFACSALSALLVSGIDAQTTLNLSTQGRNVDFTNFPYSRPVKTGPSLPASCSTGDLFFNTAAAAGQNLFACIASNTWAQQAGLGDPGSNGVVKRTAANTTAVVPAPTGAIVGTSDTQTLTNKSIDAAEISTGVLSSARIPALTGDVTTAAGSSTTALATVNNTPGSYGDATHAVQLTVDNKGRVTGINQVTITGAGQAGTTYNQQLMRNAVALTQRPTLNLSSAFTAADNSAASRTDIDLVQVNSNPGTFGSTSQIPVITVNGYGQITSISTATAAGGSSGNNISANAGTFSSIPSSCAAGALYFATDQPTGQQLYTCSSANTWAAVLSVGPSGALAVNGGSLDIVTTVVPRLSAGNTFTGVNTFANSLQLAPSGTQAACSASTRGSLWFQNNGTSKDNLQLCAYTGTTYAWVNIY